MSNKVPRVVETTLNEFLTRVFKSFEIGHCNSVVRLKSDVEKVRAFGHSIFELLSKVHALECIFYALVEKLPDENDRDTLVDEFEKLTHPDGLPEQTRDRYLKIGRQFLAYPKLVELKATRTAIEDYVKATRDDEDFAIRGDLFRNGFYRTSSLSFRPCVEGWDDSNKPIHEVASNIILPAFPKLAFQLRNKQEIIFPIEKPQVGHHLILRTLIEKTSLATQVEKFLDSKRTKMKGADLQTQIPVQGEIFKEREVLKENAEFTPDLRGRSRAELTDFQKMQSDHLDTLISTIIDMKSEGKTSPVADSLLKLLEQPGKSVMEMKKNPSIFHDSRRIAAEIRPLLETMVLN